MATILVIDDESSILHAFRRAFGDPEDTLQTASDGSEGLELVGYFASKYGERPLRILDLGAGAGGVSGSCTYSSSERSTTS